jgi:hypothetical protein
MALVLAAVVTWVLGRAMYQRFTGG